MNDEQDYMFAAHLEWITITMVMVFNELQFFVMVMEN